MAELEEPFLVVMKIMGEYSIKVILWALTGLFLGLLISVLLVVRLKKRQWFKRNNNWKYVAWLHYLAPPLVISFTFLQIGVWWAGKQAAKEEIHRLRVYTEEQTEDFFVENFALITDTSILKNGHLDSFIMNEIRAKANLNQGSAIDRVAEGTVKAGTTILLYVLTDRTAEVIGVKDEHLDKLVDAYMAQNPKQMHSALMDIIEHLSWTPIKSYLLSLLFGMLGIAVLILFPFALEIFINGKKYKRSLATSHPQV